MSPTYLVSSIPDFEIPYFWSSKEQIITAWYNVEKSKIEWKRKDKNLEHLSRCNHLRQKTEKQIDVNMNWFYLEWDRSRSGPVKVNQKFSFSTFGYSILVLKKNIENHVMKPQKNRKFSVYVFLRNLQVCGNGPSSFILHKPQLWNPEFQNFFSVIVFWCSATKKGFQTQLFKKKISNP